jgi:hypothetical protein
VEPKGTSSLFLRALSELQNRKRKGSKIGECRKTDLQINVPQRRYRLKAVRCALFLLAGERLLLKFFFGGKASETEGEIKASLGEGLTSV